MEATTMIKEKTCSVAKCSATYPATTEFFHAKVDNKDGLANACVWCKRAQSRASAKRTRRSRTELPDGFVDWNNSAIYM